MAEYRICLLCGLSKPASEFARNRLRCVLCYKNVIREYQARPEIRARRRAQSLGYEKKRIAKRAIERAVRLANKVPPTSKVCILCHRELPLAAFEPQRRQCINCRRTHQLAQKRKPEVRERQRLRDKDRVFTPAQIARRKDRSKDYLGQPEVRLRRRAVLREWQRLPKNREKSRVKSLVRYRKLKSDPDYQLTIRVREVKRRKAGRIQSEDVKRILKLQRGKCAICRKRLNGIYHLDHIVPLKRGGSGDVRNIQALCPDCNLRKSAADPIEHMRVLGFLL